MQPQSATPQFFQHLDAILIGELSRFRTGLAGADDRRHGIRADDLLDQAGISAIVARFDAKFGRTDRRAIMSMWASAYFTDALPPLLAANIMLDRTPHLDLDRVGFIMAPSLRIQALKIGRVLQPLENTDAHERFDGVVTSHLTPLIELVADRGGVTKRVLWSNVGNVFEAFLRKLDAIDPVRPGLRQARQLLASRTLPSGMRNPLHEPVRYVDGRRIRRVCCMRYLVPNETVCGVCPLDADNPARTRPARPDE